MYETIYISRENLTNHIGDSLENILFCTSIDVYKDQKVWVAGGFARVVCHKIFGIEQFKKSKELDIIDDYFFNLYGDIDFFSNSIILYVKQLEKERNRKLKNSHHGTVEGPYATSITKFYHSSYDYDRLKRVRVQFVDRFLYEDEIECLNSFDLTNAKYSISFDKNRNRYNLTYHKSALELDKKHLLDISNSGSPFLLSRIMKYYNRGLNKITGESNEKITDNLFKIKVDNWPEIYNGYYSIDYAHWIKKSNKLYKLTENQLSIFIGDFHTYIPEFEDNDGGYGRSIIWNKRDLATELIQNLN